MSNRKLSHDVALTKKTGIDLLEEAIVLVGSSGVSKNIEGSGIGDERLVERAELVADSSEAEEQECEKDYSHIGDAVGDPPQMDTGPTPMDLKFMGGNDSHNHEQTSSQDKANDSLYEVEPPIKDIVKHRFRKRIDGNLYRC